MARREAQCWTTLFSAVCIAALFAAPGVEAYLCFGVFEALPRCFVDSWKNIIHNFKWNKLSSWTGLLGGTYTHKSCCVANLSQANDDCIISLGLTDWQIQAYQKALQACKKEVGYA